MYIAGWYTWRENGLMRKEMTHIASKMKSIVITGALCCGLAACAKTQANQTAFPSSPPIPSNVSRAVIAQDLDGVWLLHGEM